MLKIERDMRISMYSREIQQHLSSSRGRKTNEEERQANNKSKHALRTTLDIRGEKKERNVST
jgi:hypothetical protein